MTQKENKKQINNQTWSQVFVVFVLLYAFCKHEGCILINFCFHFYILKYLIWFPCRTIRPSGGKSPTSVRPEKTHMCPSKAYRGLHLCRPQIILSFTCTCEIFWQSLRASTILRKQVLWELQKKKRWGNGWRGIEWKEEVPCSWCRKEASSPRNQGGSVSVVSWYSWGTQRQIAAQDLPPEVFGTFWEMEGSECRHWCNIPMQQEMGEWLDARVPSLPETTKQEICSFKRRTYHKNWRVSEECPSSEILLQPSLQEGTHYNQRWPNASPPQWKQWSENPFHDRWHYICERELPLVQRESYSIHSSLHRCQDQARISLQGKRHTDTSSTSSRCPHTVRTKRFLQVGKYACYNRSSP